MSKLQSSIYAGMRDFSADQTNEFDRARTNLATPFLYRVLDLSVARTNEIHNISGDFLFCDLATNGTATIELNNQMDAPDAPITFSAGMGLSAPFKQLKINNAAQPGAKLILLYSTGNSIIPSSSMGNINSIIQPVSVNPVAYTNTVSYSLAPGGAGLAANTAVKLIDPSVNVNGLILNKFNAQVCATSSNTPWSALIAKPSLPANMTDGDVISFATAGWVVSTSAEQAMTIDSPLRIPPGKGLYFFGGGNVIAWCYMTALYTVL